MGAKNVIVHFYNSTSTLQRKVVFKSDMQGVIDIAVEGAQADPAADGRRNRPNSGINIRYEYSPESFSGTEPDNAVLICEKVLEALGRHAGQQGDSEPAEHGGNAAPQPPRRPDRILPAAT